MRRLALWSVTLSLGLRLSVPAQESAPASPEAAPPPSPTMEEALRDAMERGVYATHSQGEVTWADLTAAFAQTTDYRDPLPWRPGQVADDMARRIAWYQIRLPDAQTRGVEQGWVDLARVAEQRRRMLIYHLESAAHPEPVEITDEEIEEQYERTRESFRIPFQFYMRMLFLSAYEEYTVQPGDTPTAIAERISGDPALALEIRDSRRRRLLDAWDVPVEEIDKQARPIDPNEVLLVPMNPEKRAQVRARLEAIRAEIDSVEDFIAACEKYSESDPRSRGEELGPFPQRGEEFLPELLEAGRTLPLNEISDVIETKHGFQLVVITRRQEEGYRPIEEVRSYLERLIRNQKRTEQVRAWMRQLLEQHGVTVSVPEGLDLSAAADTSDEVVAEVPGAEPVTVGELVREFEKCDPRTQAYFASRPEDFVITHLLLRRTDIVDQTWREAGLDWLEPLARVVDLQMTVEPYLRQMIAAEAASVEEDEVRAYFEDHIDTFSTGPLCTYYQIYRQVTPLPGSTEDQVEAAKDRVRRELAEALREIDSLELLHERLPELTDQVFADDLSPEVRGLVRERPLRQETQQLREVLESAAPAEITGPFTVGNRVMAVWLVDRHDPGPPAFEDVRDRVRHALLNERQTTLRTRWQAEDLEAADFRLLRPDPEQTEPEGAAAR